jgi:hypothetical protein
VAAALATLAAPVTLPLLLLQTMAGRWMPDVVTPLVDAVYSATPASDAAGAADDVRAAVLER